MLFENREQSPPNSVAIGLGCDLMLFENREQFEDLTPEAFDGCDLMLFENREQSKAVNFDTVGVVI